MGMDVSKGDKAAPVRLQQQPFIDLQDPNKLDVEFSSTGNDVLCSPIKKEYEHCNAWLSSSTPPDNINSRCSCSAESASRSFSSSLGGTSPYVIMPACTNVPCCEEGTLLGLSNLGNTCYANSVLQILYQCQSFRNSCITELSSSDPGGLLSELAQLFSQMSRYKRYRKLGYINPARFIDKLRECNEIFRTPDHHDAHEFYSFLVNNIGDELLHKNQKAALTSPSRYYNPFRKTCAECPSSMKSSPGLLGGTHVSQPNLYNFVNPNTWLHKLLQGTLLYETRCLCCENVSQRKEPFFDIPINVDAQTFEAGLGGSILNFAKTEFLKGKNKYVCDICNCLQEAERRLRFYRLPTILTIHLKRFNFDETLGNYARIGHRLAFPVIFSFPEDACTDSNIYGIPLSTAAEDNELVYTLFGVVVHIGTSMSHGHYVAAVQYKRNWWLINDHQVKPISEAELESFFGSTDVGEGMSCGYLLFYELNKKSDAIDVVPRRASKDSSCSTATTPPSQSYSKTNLLPKHIRNSNIENSNGLSPNMNLFSASPVCSLAVSYKNQTREDKFSSTPLIRVKCSATTTTQNNKRPPWSSSTNKNVFLL